MNCMKSVRERTQCIFAAMALACGVVVAETAPSVAYRETFPTGPGVAASDWQYHISDKGYNASKGNAWGGAPGAGSDPAVSSNPADTSSAWKGFVWLPPSGDRYLFWTDECGFASGTVESIRWHMRLEEPGAAVRVALRIGGVWLASNATFTETDATAKLPQAQYTLNLADTTWHRLDAVPGTRLPEAPTGEGSALPQGDIDAFGFYGTKRGKTHTYDTVEVRTTNGPADARLAPPRQVIANIPAITGTLAAKPLAAPALPPAGLPPLGQVVIGGGGYMTGVYPSRSQAGTAYLTSDMIGPWRREGYDAAWHLMPVESSFDPIPGNGASGVAIHPTDARIVYADVGGGTSYKQPMGLYKSTDSGAAWKRMLDKYSSANSDRAKPESGSRKWGPSIAIDPRQPDTVYWATRRDGVWRTRDGGANWTRVLEVQAACRNVVVDGSAERDGRSLRVLVGVLDQGVWVSEDGGDSFAPEAAFAALAGEQKRISWMRAADDGTVFAACGAKLLKRASGVWSDITPVGEGGFDSVAVLPGDSRRVLALRTGPGGYQKKNAWFLRSTDGGATWSAVESSAMPKAKYGGWLDEFQPMMGPAAVEIDPNRPATAWICDAFEIWQTDNAWDERPQWTAQYQGGENTVTLALAAPPALADATQAQAILFSGLSDIRGFRHTAVASMPPRRYVMAEGDWSTYVTGYDWCEADPSIVYAAKSYEASQEAKILRSTDNGLNWVETTNPYRTQKHAGGKVAVSADEPGRVVYFPSGSKAPVVTADGGRTWTPCVLEDGRPMPHLYNKCSGYNFASAQASDRVDGKTFYAFVNPEDSARAKPPLPPRFYVSRDGGLTWKLSAAVLPGANPHDSLAPVQLLTVPGSAGEVWLSLANGGLWHSKDFGATFTRDETFAGSRPLGLGIGAPDPRIPGNRATILVYGMRNGGQEWALHRSTDGGATWVTAPRTGYQNTTPMIFAADRQVFGRFCFGTPGLGIWYADTAAVPGPLHAVPRGDGVGGGPR